jgi:hypothetical protein
MLRLSAVFLFATVQGLVWAQDSGSLNTLTKVLNEYRQHPEFFDYLPAGKESFPLRSEEELKRLEPAVLKARSDEFNGKFINFSKSMKRLSEQRAILQKRFDDTPLSDITNKSQLNLKLQIQSQKVIEAKRTLFLISLDANHSIADAFATLTPATIKQIEEQKQLAEAPKPPQMPGLYQGSKWENERKAAADRINITPLEKEFYDTQLGQKIVRDLGGDVDFWSYDFDKDELYVSVNNEVSKLRVREEDSGVRFIQTRVGAGFYNPKGSDERVDELKAEGRFLASKEDKRNQTTLFGEKKSNEPVFASELPPGHFKGDGHDHSGHNH